ncbi:MAG: anti-sigma factor family protein, partial [Planctomycetota bacterium]
MTPDITCSLVERWIYLSLDGELSDDGESHLEAHLDLCSTCRRRMEEIFREQKVLEEELESISGTIDELLGSRIDATKGSRLQGAEALPDIPHRTHTWRRAAPLGIAALLLIGAGVTLWATFFQGSGAMPTTDTLARMEWSGNGLEVSAPEGGEKRIHAGSGTDLLRRGEHLFVPAGTEVRITFGDRSQCRVQGVSRVILAAGEDGLLLEMEGGNAIFLIEKQRRGFAVRTTGAWIRV